MHRTVLVCFTCLCFVGCRGEDHGSPPREVDRLPWFMELADSGAPEPQLPKSRLVAYRAGHHAYVWQDGGWRDATEELYAEDRALGVRTDVSVYRIWGQRAYVEAVLDRAGREIAALPVDELNARMRRPRAAVKGDPVYEAAQTLSEDEIASDDTGDELLWVRCTLVTGEDREPVWHLEVLALEADEEEYRMAAPADVLVEEIAERYEWLADHTRLKVIGGDRDTAWARGGAKDAEESELALVLGDVVLRGRFLGDEEGVCNGYDRYHFIARGIGRVEGASFGPGSMRFHLDSDLAELFSAGRHQTEWLIWVDEAGALQQILPHTAASETRATGSVE